MKKFNPDKNTQTYRVKYEKVLLVKLEYNKNLSFDDTESIINLLLVSNS